MGSELEICHAVIDLSSVWVVTHLSRPDPTSWLAFSGVSNNIAESNCPRKMASWSFRCEPGGDGGKAPDASRWEGVRGCRMSRGQSTRGVIRCT